MMTMLEKVASALRKKAVEIEHRPGVHDADVVWFADEFARAAIEALMEPTEVMTSAGWKLMDSQADWIGHGGDTDAVFRAMLTAALEEKP